MLCGQASAKNPVDMRCTIIDGGTRFLHLLHDSFTGAALDVFVEEPVPYDEPVIWMMLEGEASVRVDGMREPTTFRRGETVLLPARMKNPVIKTGKDCVWLEVTFPTRPEVGR